MNIILAGEEEGRPEVIAIIDNDEDLKLAIKQVESAAWDYYYVFPIEMNKIYKGCWGIDDGASWIVEGEHLGHNKWKVHYPDKLNKK